MDLNHWKHHPDPSHPEFGGYELNPELEAWGNKHEMIFNLTFFVGLNDGKDEGESEVPVPVSGEEREELLKFQSELYEAMVKECAVLPYARFWHTGVCQLEWRISKPEPVQAKLQQMIQTQDHRLNFEYRMFPDGLWMIPDKYLSGEILETADAAESEEDEDESPVSAGVEAFEEQDFEKAVGHLASEVETEAENDADRWMMLVDCLAQLGRLDEAKVRAEQALEKFEGHAGLFRALGGVLLRQGSLEMAESKLREGININGLLPSLHHNLACALALQGRKDEALDAIEVCVTMDSLRRFDVKNDTDFESLRGHPRFEALTDLSVLGMMIGSRHTENPHEHCLLVAFPERWGPQDRGEILEAPMQERLQAAGAGTVLGGAVKMGMGVIEDVSFVEIGTDTMDQALEIVKNFLIESELSDGVQLHPYTQVGEHAKPDQLICL
ncbi:MAG: tetratricopeptide repeat protein [Blastochloris sp.]|nr:tetratricopeptide repeat protein [Blastochloris sp.]